MLHDHDCSILRFLCIYFSIIIAPLAFGDDFTIHYQFPLNGAKMVSPSTHASIRFAHSVPRSTRITFDVKGEQSGAMPGELTCLEDSRTFVFQSNRLFKPDERVDVRVTRHDMQEPIPYEVARFSFTTSEQLEQAVLSSRSFSHSVTDPQTNISENDPHIRMVNGVALPSDFPMIKVSIDSSGHSEAIFMSTWGAVPYIMILDEEGNPIFYKRENEKPYDFKAHPTGVLTHFVREDVWAHVVYDSTYTRIDTLRCQNGYATDEHELRILANGHILLLAADRQPVDMSQIVEGGDPHAMVRGNHIQELDRSGNVVFEWRCWDHFNITDADHVNLTSPNIDFTHANALDIDTDGHILLSSRNLSEITKINRETGEIIWRLGGKNNQFTFTNDAGFSYQHSIRSLSNGNYLLFDNGTYRKEQYSRAVEYHLDRTAMTATKVWEYRNDPDFYIPALGNVQRLDNGNTLINWAYPNHPKLVEVNPEGCKVFELDFQVPANVYRTFRLPWSGTAQKPYLIAESHNDCVALVFNQFGDERIKYFNIYGGVSPNPKQILATSLHPFKLMTDLQNHQRYYFRVTSVDFNDEESAFSNQCVVPVHIAKRGENILVNGDFRQENEFWQLQQYNTAQARGTITEQNEYHVQILNPGNRLENIKLIQEPIKLTKHATYTLEFDAYADRDRLFDVKLEKITIPWTNYSKIGQRVLGKNPRHYSYTFVMSETSDARSRLCFDVGGNTADVYLSNISLRRIDGTVVHQTPKRPTKFEILENYPNPFNHSTTINYTLASKSNIEIKLFNVLGEEVAEILNTTQDAGHHRFRYIAPHLSTGIYFVTLRATTVGHAKTFTRTQKIMYLK